MMLYQKVKDVNTLDGSGRMTEYTVVFVDQ